MLDGTPTSKQNIICCYYFIKKPPVCVVGFIKQIGSCCYHNFPTHPPSPSQGSVSIRTAVISLLVLTLHSVISHPPYIVLTLITHPLHVLPLHPRSALRLSDALSSPFQAPVSIQAAAITFEPLQCNNVFANLFLRHPPALHPNKKFIYGIKWILL